MKRYILSLLLLLFINLLYGQSKPGIWKVRADSAISRIKDDNDNWGVWKRYTWNYSPVLMTFNQWIGTFHWVYSNKEGDIIEEDYKLDSTWEDDTFGGLGLTTMVFTAFNEYKSKVIFRIMVYNEKGYFLCSLLKEVGRIQTKYDLMPLKDE